MANRVVNCYASTEKIPECLYLPAAITLAQVYPWEFLISDNWVNNRVRSFNSSSVRVYCVLTDSILVDCLTCKLKRSVSDLMLKNVKKERGLPSLSLSLEKGS